MCIKEQETRNYESIKVSKKQIKKINYENN